MGRVRRRSGGVKAPIDDRAPHIWIMITYEREWGRGRPPRVSAPCGREGAAARSGEARRARGDTGQGDGRRRARPRPPDAAVRQGARVIIYGAPGSAAWLWACRRCR
jgi:hypothetical protein